MPTWIVSYFVSGKKRTITTASMTADEKQHATDNKPATADNNRKQKQTYQVSIHQPNKQQQQQQPKTTATKTSTQQIQQQIYTTNKTTKQTLDKVDDLPVAWPSPGWQQRVTTTTSNSRQLSTTCLSLGVPLARLDPPLASPYGQPRPV